MTATAGVYIPTWFIGAWLGLLGAIMGSYVNVCVDRWPRGQSTVRPPSRCDACGERLAWHELIPVVSYITLKGRCGHCGAAISPRLPWTEALGGASFALAFWVFGLNPVLLTLLPFFLVLLCVGGTDVTRGIILDRCHIAITVLALASLALSGFNGWEGSLWGALLGGGFLLGMKGLSLFIIKKDGMGWGDIKLMASAGLYLGLGNTALALFIAVVAGAGAGVVLLATKKGGRHTEMPFGPFLAVGCAIAALYGGAIIEWYWGMITGILI